ncbi:MAG TPA: hypothetical protein VII01_08175 [Solirubrobacteraceae bacterium]
MLSVLATLTLIGLACWLFAGVLLRLGGTLLALGGLLATATGTPQAAGLAILGAVAWLVGHWLFAVRNHYFSSPLARRIYELLPRPLDPTQGWGIPVTQRPQRDDC